MYNLKDKKDRSWLFLSNSEDKVALYHKIQLGEYLNLPICLLQQTTLSHRKYWFLTKHFQSYKDRNIYVIFRMTSQCITRASHFKWFSFFLVYPLPWFRVEKISVHQCLGIGIPLPPSRKMGALLTVIFYKKPREV